MRAQITTLYKHAEQRSISECTAHQTLRYGIQAQKGTSGLDGQMGTILFGDKVFREVDRRKR